jgi:hypothetical protein
LQKNLTTTGKRYPKVSTRGRGEKTSKKAEKWWDCTFPVNMEGQRLIMCVFKKGVIEVTWDLDEVPNLGA